MELAPARAWRHPLLPVFLHGCTAAQRPLPGLPLLSHPAEAGLGACWGGGPRRPPTQEGKGGRGAAEFQEGAVSIAEPSAPRTADPRGGGGPSAFPTGLSHLLCRHQVRPGLCTCRARQGGVGVGDRPACAQGAWPPAVPGPAQARRKAGTGLASATSKSARGLPHALTGRRLLRRTAGPHGPRSPRLRKAACPSQGGWGRAERRPRSTNGMRFREGPCVLLQTRGRNGNQMWLRRLR